MAPSEGERGGGQSLISLVAPKGHNLVLALKIMGVYPAIVLV